MDEIAALPSDDTDVSEDFSAPRRCIVGRNRQQPFALGKCFIEATSRDVELNLVDGEIELTGSISVFFERLRGKVVGALGVAELTKLHVGERDVVENLGLVVAHAQRLVAEVAESKSFESGAQISSNHGDGAEVLVDHRDEGTVARELRLGASGLVNRGGLIQVAADLVDDTDYVERLCDRWGGANEVCRGQIGRAHV